MELNFKIQNDSLIAGSILQGKSGNVGTYVCKFDILDNKDFLWFGVFKKGDSAYQQVIEDGRCIVPKEVLENSGNVEIGCYGTNGDMRISTNWLIFSVKDGAYCDATAPEEPTPDVWEVLVMNTLPYIGETGNWYVYDKEKKEYVNSGVQAKGEKGDKGDMGLTETTRFPQVPQIDITTEELVRYIDVDEINGVPLKDYNFTYAKVLCANSPQSEYKGTEFQARLNNSNAYTSAPTVFLYNASQLYWGAHFDIKNGLILGLQNAVEHPIWRNNVQLAASAETIISMDTITYMRFSSVLYDIPVGTNIKVWFK